MAKTTTKAEAAPKAVDKKPWDESIIGFFENESDYGVWYKSITITPEILERFTELQVGSRLKFRILSRDKRKKVAAYLDHVVPPGTGGDW